MNKNKLFDPGYVVLSNCYLDKCVLEIDSRHDTLDEAIMRAEDGASQYPGMEYYVCPVIKRIHVSAKIHTKKLR